MGVPAAVAQVLIGHNSKAMHELYVTVGRSCIKVVWKERHINRPAGLLLADHEEDRVNCGWLEPL